MNFRALLLVPVLALSLFATSMVHGDDVSQAEARQLVARGVLKPLSTILDAIHAEFGGTVLEVELEHDDGEYVYEIEILTADGRVLELEYDARTGRRLKLEEDD